jgi:hypothetical protein
MTLLTFTHANLHTPVEVVKEQIFSFYYSGTHKCVLLLAVGGAMIPVSESVESVHEKIKANTPPKV